MITLIRSAALVRRFSLSNVIAPPIGLAYLAGTLKKRNLEYKIIDATGENLDQIFKPETVDAFAVGLKNTEIVERIPDKTDIIGLSCMFSSSWNHDLQLIKLIHKRFPDAKIVLGGEHSTACADYILKNHSEVNFCVHGEGEETLIELIHSIRNDQDYKKTKGISYKENDVIITNDRRSRISDIDTIPLPDWESIPIANYMDRGIGHGATNTRNMPLLASRGCPFQCTFCSSAQMWTTKWVVRDYKKVADEMEFYIKTFKAENFDLYDLTAIIRKDWIIQFAKEICARKLNITYQLPSGTRSEAIDSEVAYWLKKSGCHELNYAPESGSIRTLKLVKKRVNLENLLRSTKQVCSQGIKVMCNIVLFPNDTWRDFFLTYKFMIRASFVGLHDITFVPFVPYPGTELYAELLKNGKVPPMSEKYFNDLMIHSDLSKANSYNKTFDSRLIIALRIFFLGSFYLSNYLFRPIRAIRMIKNVIMNTPQTRGEGGLLILMRKLRWNQN